LRKRWKLRSTGSAWQKPTLRSSSSKSLVPPCSGCEGVGRGFGPVSVRCRRAPSALLDVHPGAAQARVARDATAAEVTAGRRRQLSPLVRRARGNVQVLGPEESKHPESARGPTHVTAARRLKRPSQRPAPLRLDPAREAATARDAVPRLPMKYARSARPARPRRKK
jgi:hypothetical protein